MAEEQQQAGQVLAQPQAQGAETNPTGQEPGDKHETFSREYVEELRRENAKHRTEKAQAEAARQQQEQAALAEQGKWKELAEAREKEIADRDARLAAKEREVLIARLAKDLPAELAARVQGTTEAEIAADVAKLAALVTPPAAGGAKPTSGSPTNAARKDPTEPAADPKARPSLNQAYRRPQ